MTASATHSNESGFYSALDVIREWYKNEPGASEKEMEERLAKGKREHFRKPFFTVVDYSAAGAAYRDFIKNISPGGAFIETPMPFSVGQELSLTFVLPGSRKHIKITGEIVWVSPQGIGVKFRVPKARRQETAGREGAERRRHRRFGLQVGAFVLLNQPVSLVGEVLDMGMGGLSFRCSSEAEIPRETWELDILCAHGGDSVGEVPFTAVTELPFSKEEKRYGVRFERLTNKQASQLRAFIEAHTPATS